MCAIWMDFDSLADFKSLSLSLSSFLSFSELRKVQNYSSE